MKIFFRVDASQKIGTGHLIRCLTLAHELAKRGADIEFLCRELPPNLGQLVTGHGFKLSILPDSDSKNDEYAPHSHWLESHWQEDAAQTLLKVNGADWLIVDHYALDEKWESMIYPHIDRLMVIDDLADRKHKCDLLLDQNHFIEAETRYRELIDSECQVLFSPKYALLREEFAYARARLKRTFKGVNKILIFFGGVDANNDAGKAAEALKDYKGEITIVAGSANMNYPALEKFCEGKPSFHLFKSVNNMAQLMSEADLAIGGGGSTSWERAALGLPTLAWAVAENQVPVLKDLDKSGVLRLTTLEKLEKDVKTFKNDELKKMSLKAADICDAEGATRVANKLWSFE